MQIPQQDDTNTYIDQSGADIITIEVNSFSNSPGNAATSHVLLVNLSIWSGSLHLLLCQCTGLHRLDDRRVSPAVQLADELSQGSGGACAIAVHEHPVDVGQRDAHVNGDQALGLGHELVHHCVKLVVAVLANKDGSSWRAAKHGG